MSQEQVNHPSHYGGEDNTYEAIKVIENWNLGFCLGNVVKYISRAGKKDSGKTLEDLRKALWYLQREISNLEAVEKSDAFLACMKEMLDKSTSHVPATGGLLPPLKNPPFSGEYGGCDAHIVYCSDFNQHSKSTPPILTTQDSEEKLDLGATNRLKPVEDKAEIPESLCPAYIREHFKPKNLVEDIEKEVVFPLTKKWLEDAYDEPVKDDLGWFDRDKFGSRPDEDVYDEPLIRHTTGDSIMTGLKKLAEDTIDVPPATGWVRI